jgi:hypothetical protein
VIFLLRSEGHAAAAAVACVARRRSIASRLSGRPVLAGEGQQQAHGVAVGGDRVRARLALSGEPVGEEPLQSRGQCAPRDHPWRTMPHHGMTPHVSGSSLSAQARYAAGTREILECWFAERPIREEYLIVEGGGLAGAGAHSYSTRETSRNPEEGDQTEPG